MSVNALARTSHNSSDNSSGVRMCIADAPRGLFKGCLCGLSTHTHTHIAVGARRGQPGFCSKRRRGAKAVQRSVESFVTQTQKHIHTVQQNGVNGVCRRALGMVWRVFVRNKYEQRLLAKTGHCVSCVCSNVCVCVFVYNHYCVYTVRHKHNTLTNARRQGKANTHTHKIFYERSPPPPTRDVVAVTIRDQTHAL